MLRALQFGFDGDEGLGDRLVSAVLSGAKTATASLAVEYLSGEHLPRVGERLRLVDSAGTERGTVETTRIAIIPLHLVGDDVAADEGEGFADAADWRRDHVEFWAQTADLIRADAGDSTWELRDSEPVVVEWFRLLSGALPAPQESLRRSPAPPRVLTIAGSDSGGGAGIQADLKTMLALGVHGMSVITAVTAQNSLGVQGSWVLPVEAIEAQFRSVVDDIGVQAVKTGMLSSPEVVEMVAQGLADVGAPVVVDPVAVSKHGDPLLSLDAVAGLKELLLPLATIVTPNLPEVEALTGIRVEQEQDLPRAADAVLALGPRWVLIKGGHLAGDAVDLLTDGDQVWELRAAREDNRHTHGTGCTLASAVAAYLALGREVPDAVAAAKDYVTGALRAGFALGAGIGPVDHGWRWR